MTFNPGDIVNFGFVEPWVRAQVLSWDLQEGCYTCRVVKTLYDPTYWTVGDIFNPFPEGLNLVSPLVLLAEESE